MAITSCIQSSVASNRCAFVAGRLTLLLAGLLASALAVADFAPLTKDAFVVGYSREANNNTGSVSIIKVSTDGPRIGLMQFDLSGITGTVSSATLTFNVVQVLDAGTLGLHVVTGPTWAENSVTYNTRPGFQATAATTTAVGFVGSVSVDVTTIVQQWVSNPSSNYGLALTMTGGYARLASKESGNGATLDVQTSGGAPPDPGVTVLDFSSGSAEITSPGDYVLDQDWSAPGLSLSICANDVFVDFSGYTVDSSYEIASTVTPGLQFNLCPGSNGVRVSGDGRLIVLSGVIENFITTLDVSLGARCSELCTGGASTSNAFRNSRAYLVEVFDNWVIDGNHLRGLIMSPNTGTQSGEPTVAKIFDNEFLCLGGADCVALVGAGTIFKRNTVWVWPPSDDSAILKVSGGEHSIVGNVFRYSPGSSGEWNCVQFGCPGTLVEVLGYENVIRGNITVGPTGGRLANGLKFTGSDGNFYGDNHFNADVPYDEGGTTQVDLGGNR